MSRFDDVINQIQSVTKCIIQTGRHRNPISPADFNRRKFSEIC